MNYNPRMGFNEQDYQLIKTSLSELKKSSNQKEALRYLTNVLPDPTDVVSLDNAQDTVKSVKAQLVNKNLIPYPYKETTKTTNGITFTVNSDGTITAKGTATNSAVFQLYSSAGGSKPMNVANKTITISGCPAGGNFESYFILFSYGGNSYQEFGNGITITPDADITAVQLRIAAGATVNNLTFKPQLELGSTATAYTPYVSDFTTVKVISYGKNLLSAMSLYPTTTDNAVPIHFKAGQQYTISFTTTYTVWRLMFFGTDKNGTAFDGSSQNANKYISGMYTGTTGRLQHANNQSGNTLTFTCNEDCIITAIVFWNVANETDKFFFDFQLELGTTATEYEPYQSAEYTPTATGEATGITVLTPTTNISNDKGLLFTKVIGDVFNYIN